MLAADKDAVEEDLTGRLGTLEGETERLAGEAGVERGKRLAVQPDAVG